MPQGAAPARVPSVAGVQAVAGDSASYEDTMKELALGKAQFDLQTAELRFETDAKLSAMKVDTQEQLNENKIAISDLQVEQVHLRADITKVGATANCALESSKNTIERVDGLDDQLRHTATKKELQSFKEEMLALRRSEDDGMKEITQKVRSLCISCAAE